MRVEYCGISKRCSYSPFQWTESDKADTLGYREHKRPLRVQLQSWKNYQDAWFQTQSQIRVKWSWKKSPKTCLAAMPRLKRLLHWADIPETAGPRASWKSTLVPPPRLYMTYFTLAPIYRVLARKKAVLDVSQPIMFAHYDWMDIRMFQVTSTITFSTQSSQKEMTKATSWHPYAFIFPGNLMYSKVCWLWLKHDIDILKILGSA